MGADRTSAEQPRPHIARRRRRVRELRWRLNAALVAVAILLIASLVLVAAQLDMPGARAIAEAPTVVFDVVVLVLVGAGAWLASRSRLLRSPSDRAHDSGR